MVKSGFRQISVTRKPQNVLKTFLAVSKSFVSFTFFPHPLDSFLYPTNNLKRLL